MVYDNLKTLSQSLSVPIRELHSRFGQPVTIYIKTVQAIDQTDYFSSDTWVGKGTQTVVKNTVETYTPYNTYLILPIADIYSVDLNSPPDLDEVVIPFFPDYTPKVGDKIFWSDNERSYEYVIDEIPKSQINAFYLVNLKFLNSLKNMEAPNG